MADQKIDNLLNLAMDATAEEREKSWNLNVGYDERERLWDVIVKYSGEAEGLAGEGITVVPLLGGYAVVTLPEAELERYSERQQVEFVEKPKRLYFSDYQANIVSCIRSVQTGGAVPPGGGLSGRGVLLGIVDSGVDYRHPDFCNADGTTRIVSLWDQSGSAGLADGEEAGARRPPQGYSMGVEYTREMINEALAVPAEEGYRIVPERDFSGHGTSVLGIAAGNGRASEGVERGVAYESEIVAVKLGIARENSFPRTTELMQGIDYLVRKAQALGRPMAVNISFGNNYGSHEPCN